MHHHNVRIYLLKRLMLIVHPNLRKTKRRNLENVARVVAVFAFVSHVKRKRRKIRMLDAEFLKKNPKRSPSLVVKRICRKNGPHRKHQQFQTNAISIDLETYFKKVTPLHLHAVRLFDCQHHRRGSDGYDPSNLLQAMPWCYYPICGSVLLCELVTWNRVRLTCKWNMKLFFKF